MSLAISSDIREHCRLSRREACQVLDIIHGTVHCSSEIEFHHLLRETTALLSPAMQDFLIGHFSALHREPAQEADPAFAAAALLITEGPGPEYDKEYRCHSILQHLLPHLESAYSRIRTDGGREAVRPRLTYREKEVLNWIRDGKSTHEIAIIIGISQNTVKFHLKNIHQKLNTSSRSHALSVAMSNRLIDA